MNWKRARTPEQKALREQTILKAAEELFTQMDYQEVSLNAIARKAGFAKSNVYRYFATREEIFLQLFVNTFSNWADELSKALLSLEVHSHAKVIAKTWVQVTMRHKDLLDLAPFLYVALERHSSEEALLKFHTATDVPMKKAEKALQRVVPGMSEQTVFDLVLYFHCLTAGLWPLAQMSEIRERLHNKREESVKHIDYEEYMSRALQMIIEGLKKEID